MRVVQGLVVSLVLYVAVMGALLAVIGGDAWSVAPIALVAVPFPAIGLTLGYAGTRIRARRFLKLFGLGLALVYLTALAIAAVLILLDGSGMISGWDIAWSIFYLGSIGSFFYGVFTVPALLVGVFVIERWTRPGAAALA